MADQEHIALCLTVAVRCAPGTAAALEAEGLDGARLLRLLLGAESHIEIPWFESRGPGPHDVICRCRHWIHTHDWTLGRPCESPGCTCSRFVLDPELNTPWAIEARREAHEPDCLCAWCRELREHPPPLPDWY